MHVFGRWVPPNNPDGCQEKLSTLPMIEIFDRQLLTCTLPHCYIFSGVHMNQTESPNTR